MKLLLSIRMTAFLAVIFFSCSQSRTNSNSSQEIQLSQIPLLQDNPVASDSTGIASEIPDRRFLRTADFKFKVNEVSEAIQFIENKTRELGGFVSFSSLQNTICDSSSIPVSIDSLQQVIQYSTEGILRLRVPDDRLDSMLTALQPLIVLINKREIVSDDVSLQILTNQFSKRRALHNYHRLTSAINQNGKKLKEIISAEKLLADQEQFSDEAKLSNLRLEDAVKFSTIFLNIYQAPSIRYTRIEREINIPVFESPFIIQIHESIIEGWQLIKNVIVSIVKLWSLLLFSLICYFILLKYFKSGKEIKTS